MNLEIALLRFVNGNRAELQLEAAHAVLGRYGFVKSGEGQFDASFPDGALVQLLTQPAPNVAERRVWTLRLERKIEPVVGFVHELAVAAGAFIMAPVKEAGPRIIGFSDQQRTELPPDLSIMFIKCRSVEELWQLLIRGVHVWGHYRDFVDRATKFAGLKGGYGAAILAKNLTAHAVWSQIGDALRWRHLPTFDTPSDVFWSSLSRGERAYLLTADLSGEVCNGGFDQYFSNTGCKHVHETLEALRMIGALEYAELLEKALQAARIPNPIPPGYEYGQEWSETSDERLSPLDSEFQRSPGVHIFPRMVEYVRQHPEEFV